MLTSLLLILLLMGIDWLDQGHGLMALLQRQPLVLRWAIYYVMVSGVFVNVVNGNVVQDFIYFQF
jgi:hypothetical protein